VTDVVVVAKNQKSLINLKFTKHTKQNRFRPTKILVNLTVAKLQQDIAYCDPDVSNFFFFLILRGTVFFVYQTHLMGWRVYSKQHLSG
jgi:hypothetical protein